MFSKHLVCMHWNLCVLSISIGDGKTHYINKELSKFKPFLIIAVHESFTPLSAIMKLRSLPNDTSCSIFFNFTIAPSTVSNMCSYIHTYVPMYISLLTN